MPTRKRSKKSEALPMPPAPALPAPSFVSSLFFNPISAPVALAFVVFAAGSVMAMTSIASAEIAMGDYSPVPTHLAYDPARTMVLGDSTSQAVIDDSALEAGDPSGAIYPKPLSFDSSVGRWDYNISYRVVNATGNVTLTIGTYILAGNLSASGTVETGAILKPNKAYHVSLWQVDSGGAKQNLAHYELKTGNGKTSTKPVPQPCSLNQSASSTSSSLVPQAMCVKNSNGQVQCPEHTCLPPPNGYSSTTPPHMPPPPFRPDSSSTPPNFPPLR